MLTFAGWQQHWQLDNLAAAYGSTLFAASKLSGCKAAVLLGDCLLLHAAGLARQTRSRFLRLTRALIINKLPNPRTKTLNNADVAAGWQQHWQLDSLAAAYGSTLFSASKPSGGKAAVLLSDYILSYMARQADEEPLYVFDEDIGEAAPGMLSWYAAPSVVQGALAAVLREWGRGWDQEGEGCASSLPA